MKRKLLVIRHAQTEYQQSGQTDHQRELTAQGRSDALRVAARIQELGWTPQKLVSSDSTRTTQTWKQMSEVFDASVDATFTDSLYLAGLDEVCDELFALPEDVNEVAVLGHNPGWQNIVHWLSGTAVRMGPGTAVLLKGEGETWADALRQNKWEIDEIIRPEQL